jgi:hypothetical protein
MVDGGDVETLIRVHFERRPLMRAKDAYKLLHQGVFGVGHIMGDRSWAWLKAEAEGLDLEEQPDEPLLEEISADGSMVRVNLRPYMRRGLPLERLFSAMKETAGFGGSPRDFLEAWIMFKTLANSGEIGADKAEIEALDEGLRSGEFRPQHHSDAYRDAYRPAYRVVRRESLTSVLDPKEIK